MDHGLWTILSLPWRLTMPSAGDKQFIGPLFLAFLPSLLFLRSKDPTLRFFIKISLISFFLGLCMSHMLRFSMPAFLLSLLLLTALYFSLKDVKWRILWIVGIGFCALLFPGNYLENSADNYDGGGIWTGKETQEQYLNRKLPNSYEPLAQWIRENLPENARLLIVGDSRAVYYEHPFWAQSVFDEPFFAQAARQSRGAQGILRSLQQMGITHVVVNSPEGLRVSKEYHLYELKPSEWGRLNDFIRRGLKPVYWKDLQGVYEVQSQLTPPQGILPPNLFSFFAPQAHDFFQDFQYRNFTRASAELKQLLVLFPGEDYWKKKGDLPELARRVLSGRP
jgi:hypothetical protein